jgi:hypothetical protein
MVLVPTQHNGYDCGSFTCCFAYALYQLRNQCFTYHVIYKERSPLLSKVTNAELFNFDQLLVNDLWNQLGQLIDNLSAVYRLPTIEGPFDIFDEVHEMGILTQCTPDSVSQELTQVTADVAVQSLSQEMAIKDMILDSTNLPETFYEEQTQGDTELMQATTDVAVQSLSQEIIEGNDGGASASKRAAAIGINAPSKKAKTIVSNKDDEVVNDTTRFSTDAEKKEVKGSTVILLKKAVKSNAIQKTAKKSTVVKLMTPKRAKKSTKVKVTKPTTKVKLVSNEPDEETKQTSQGISMVENGTKENEEHMTKRSTRWDKYTNRSLYW